MHRDGLSVLPEEVSSLLKLFTKAAQICLQGGQPIAILRRAEEFLQNMKEGWLGHPPVGVNACAVRELVKALCVLGREGDAWELLRHSGDRLGVAATGGCYEPLLFLYGGIKGEPTLAEDVLIEVVNKGLAVTDAAVDSLVLGYIRGGDLSEALEKMHDLFNQHRARPTVSTLLLLLDSSLEGGDLFEARRVVAFVREVFSQQERLQAVGDTTSLGGGKEGEDKEEISFGRKTRLGTPLGRRESGVLSEQKLRDRFKRFGHSL